MPFFPVDDNDKELLRQFQEDFTELIFDDAQPVLLEISKHQAWVIFITMQLALRHPGFPIATVDMAREIAKKIQDILATTPALLEVSNNGWNPEHDI